MPRPNLALGALVLVPALAAAQSRSSVEIGSSVGVTILTANGSTLTHIGVPGAGIQASPMVFVTYIQSNLMVEPQLALTSISGGGGSATEVGAALQLGYLFTPGGRGSGYLGANAALESFSGDITGSGTAFGGAVGYRARVGRGSAVRLEARYRHWLGDFDGLNEIAFGIGLAGIL
jgi:hypothetical protein